MHPTVVFSLLDSAAAKLPAGMCMPTQQSFPCGTCHLPHGSGSDDQKVLAAIATTQPAELALQLRSAARPLLRPDVPRDICATCHGSDAQRVFLYYHRAPTTSGRADAGISRGDGQLIEYRMGRPTTGTEAPPDAGTTMRSAILTTEPMSGTSTAMCRLCTTARGMGA